MATSGSTDFTRTRDEIINHAYNLLGVYGIGRTISSEDIDLAATALNMMVKGWQAKGILLWAKTEGVLFVADNTADYLLNNTSASARATKWDDAVITELNGAHASGATALTVDSTTDMAANDIIGIVLDDDAVTWTTITTVDSSTTLTVGALDSAAADNNNVYTFTSRVNKPLRIHSMRRALGVDSEGSTTSTRTEIPMISLTHEEYHDLPTKTTNGVASHYYYNRQRDDGTVHLWPRPDTPDQYYRFTYTRLLEDFDASTDNPDFPQEWIEALTYQLAVRLAPAFGKDQRALSFIAPLASSLLSQMLDWSTEVDHVSIIPDRGSM